jgi:hypothetical protein
VRLPSPALHLAPPQLSEAAILEQSLRLLLNEAVLDEWTGTLRTYRGEMNLGSLVAALRLWRLWDQGGPLSVGRWEIVRWLYTDIADQPTARNGSLPHNYEHFCSTHAVWHLSPVSLAIPLPCTKLDPPVWYPQSAPTHLRSMMRDSPEPQEAARVLQNRGETIALATVLEYVVAVHGREQLPVLLRTPLDHPNWETLVPAVFGMSVVEFEAGWHDYLAAEYGVVIPPKKIP